MSPDLPAIPPALVEAAARAEYAVDAAAEESDDFEPIEWDQALARVKDYYRQRAAAGLAAALAECEVREEWGANVTYRGQDGNLHDLPVYWRKSELFDVDRIVEAWSPTPVVVMRRLVITTKPSAVDTPREDPRS